MAFKRAVKYGSKLRMAIAGPAGSGKTYTALTLATALANGKPIAVIDTERGSAAKYADIFDFDSDELTNFSPVNYVNSIKEAERAGYAVLIIDSLSHAWNGIGGALEMVDLAAKRAAAKSGRDNPNTWNAWSNITPLQNRLIDSIVGSSIHIIATMRTKTEYVIETVNNKSVPRKIGTAPIQRADMEYEFDIYADMDISNTMIIQKSRCSALSGQIVEKPDASLAEVIGAWLDGVSAPVEPAVEPAEVDALKATWSDAYSIPDQQIETRWSKYIAHILGRTVSESGIKRSDYDHLAQDIMRQLEAVEPATQEKPKLTVVGKATPEPEKQPSEADHKTVEQAITEQQLRSIRKLSEYLNKPEPEGITVLTNVQAGQIIQQLTSEYKTVRSQAK